MSPSDTFHSKFLLKPSHSHLHTCCMVRPHVLV